MLRTYKLVTLAIDPASSATGLAYLDHSKLLATQTLKTKPDKEPYERAADVLTSIMAFYNHHQWKMRYVIIEQPPSVVYHGKKMNRNAEQGKSARLTVLHQFYGAICFGLSRMQHSGMYAILPSQWQNGLFDKRIDVPHKGESITSKDRALFYASSMYPNAKFTEHTADAVCMAYWTLCKSKILTDHTKSSQGGLP